ncbi:hypothetical protein FRB95_006177 [Tulasnella sp. JGI-2019a]|nr:hypothetical protein FRB95_006177 [Tulasnella sp. JGI-2019a]
MTSLQRILLPFIVSLLLWCRSLEAEIVATSSYLTILEVTQASVIVTGITMTTPRECSTPLAATSEVRSSSDASDATVKPTNIIATALVATITMPPTEIPSATTPTTAPKSKTVIAIVGVVTTVALAAIALWQGGQGIIYPRREHQETMKTLVAQRKTAEELLKAAEEGSARREMAEQIR